MKPAFPAFGIGAVPVRAPAGPPAGVPSPCINVCHMDADTGHCQGCWRSIDEIAMWSQLNDDDKLSVLALIEMRRSAAPDPFAP